MISVVGSETGTGGFGRTDRDGTDGFGQRVGRMFLRGISRVSDRFGGWSHAPSTAQDAADWDLSALLALGTSRYDRRSAANAPSVGPFRLQRIRLAKRSAGAH